MSEETKVHTGLAVDESTMEALNRWAAEDRRSRNSLIHMILVRAIEQRQAVKTVANALRKPLSAGASPNADSDQAAA